MSPTRDTSHQSVNNAAANYPCGDSRSFGSVAIEVNADSFYETWKSLWNNGRMSMNITYVRVCVCSVQVARDELVSIIYEYRTQLPRNRLRDRKLQSTRPAAGLLRGQRDIFYAPLVLRRNLPQKSWFLGSGGGRHPVSFPRTKWRPIITTPGPSGLHSLYPGAKNEQIRRM